MKQQFFAQEEVTITVEFNKTIITGENKILTMEGNKGQLVFINGTRESTKITLDEARKEAKEFLLTKGTDLSYGARPLRRAIQRYVEDELSDRILRAELNDGQKVEITRNEETDQLVFLITD